MHFAFLQSAALSSFFFAKKQPCSYLIKFFGNDTSYANR